MNTRILMIASALFLLALGIVLQFLPHDVLGGMGVQPTGFAPVLAQMTGALFIGFAVLNWMAKSVLIGGIYARPLALANLGHFVIGGLTMVRYATRGETPWQIWAITVLYLVFAAAFAIVFVTHPRKRQA